MAVGNTFGATALSSYGGFWIAFAIILTPGGFDIAAKLEKAGPEEFNNSMGLFLMVLNIPVFLFFSNTNKNTGLVHLYLPPTHLHPPLHRRLLLPVLLPRPGLSVARNWLSSPRLHWRSHHQHHQSWRVLCHPRRVLGLVQCSRRYTGHEQQLLCYSCGAFPLV